MLDEILQSRFIDRCLKFLDKKNFFYPGAKVLATVAQSIFKFKAKDFNIYSIGQSHLDAAWLWRRIDTIRKNNVTFSNALRHLEDYPFYTFSNSSPLYFAWMEQYFPDKFEIIKKRVEEGRLELLGGMWIEPDVNIPSGESLVRQRLYGQRYFLEKFGRISTIGWLSDSFGYPWTLPQIMAKSGSKYFYTNKMSWNEITKHPFMAFHWQAPDGSKVLTYSFPYSLNIFTANPSIGQFKENTGVLKDIEEHRIYNYESDYEEIKKSRTKKYLQDLAFVYGLGDGGGGPLRLEIIYLKEFLRHKLFKKFITALEYFHKIEKNQDEFPIWNDELYLETHQGTYTSQVWLKALNRKTEFDFYNLEAISSLSSFFGGQYQKEKINKLWKIFLFNQFHDILPGSGVPAVYEDVRKDFKKINSVSTRILRDAYKILLEKITVPHEGLIVFNTQCWRRDALLTLEDEEKYRIMDKNGTEVTSQISSNKQLFLAKEIPSMGYTYFALEKAETRPDYDTDLSTYEEGNVIFLENRFLKVQVSKKSGLVLSIYHKDIQKEILTAPGNRVQIYKDNKTGMFAAWNISKDYNRNPIRLTEEIKVELKENGPVRLTLEIHRYSSKPPVEINQTISLLANTDRVDFHLFLKYHLKSTIVKLAFPFNVDTDKIQCEIPFGVISRSTKPVTKPQKAQLEISAHKWVDLSQDDYGVTLINKSRYGYDARFIPKYKNIVRMTVLRVQRYPRAGHPLFSFLPTMKIQEQDEFSVDYALFVHKGNWTDANSVLQAYEFNNAPLQIPVNANSGPLPEECEFLSIRPKNVILSAMKGPEDDHEQSVVLRVYETEGKETEAELKFADFISLQKAAETDLLELNPKELEPETNSLKFTIKPYEIKTLLIQYQISI